jgi:hypothetical protein
MARGAIQWQEGPRVRIRFAPAMSRADFVLRRWLVPMSSNASSNYENLIRTVARRGFRLFFAIPGTAPVHLAPLDDTHHGTTLSLRAGSTLAARDGHRPRFLPRRYGGPKIRRGGPNAHRSMFAFASDGSYADGRRGAKNFKNRAGSLVRGK